MIKWAIVWYCVQNRRAIRLRFAAEAARNLKKLFCEMKIPLILRNRLAVLSNDKQDVLWVEGFGACECVRVDENTKKVLLIEYVKQE